MCAPAPQGFSSSKNNQSRLVASNEVDDAEAFFAAWSPGGDRLFYLSRSTDHFTIREASQDGGAGRVLVDFDDPARQHVRYGFATDGRLFYFTVGSHESDIWTMELETGR